MKLKLFTAILFGGIFYLLPVPSNSQSGTVKQIKLEDFQLQSSAVITSSGEVLSKADYRPDVYWFPVKVPSTVLTGLVANKVYPDPYTGMNNMLIPDASDEFNKKYNLEQYSFLPGEPNPWKKPYWYRTTFVVPAADQGRHFELIFKGINYRAAVWLNGRQVADSTAMAGMFAEYNLDVSGQIIAGGDNALAVKIYPLDFPGLPAEEQLKALGDFFENGGPTGDIGKNVTMLCSVGWDWIPPVRDRNIGIWQPVYLRTTGPVTLSRPQIVTDLPNLPDTDQARVTLKFTLNNFSRSSEKGTLKVKISPENFPETSIEFNEELSIPAGSSKLEALNPDRISQLVISQPHLWWPNGYGKPNLYRLNVQFNGNDEVSDNLSMVFGIRTVSSKATEVKGRLLRRDFYVNGKRVHLVGGAWVPDMMLRRDSTRFAHEIRLNQNANVNLLRIWGGGITPPDIFFDLADRMGMLVWSDFWVTGDTQGEFKGSPDWPLESRVFIDNITSTIYRIRNHPSLLVWTGGNEGHARKELYDAMRDSVISLDGTRPFIPSSSGYAKLPRGWNGSWPDNLASGVYSGGPYSWKDPHVYYNLADKAGDWVFKDETGIPSQPPYNTLQKIIPDLVWDRSLPFPLNHTWGYHDAATGNGRYDLYYKDMVSRYGEPASMEEFSDKMQLMNATGYQGIFEAAGHKINDNGGVMLWKLNAAFPSVVWQIYDWYLEPNAGYYFMQNACEPLHIQLNWDDSVIAVVNRTYHTAQKLTAAAAIYDIAGKTIFTKSAILDLSTTEAKEIMPVSSALAGIKGISFLILNLRDGNGRVISHNAYWLAPGSDFRTLTQMPRTAVVTQVTGMTEKNGEKQWTINIANHSDQVAFFIRPQLMQHAEEVMPSFWSAGYFTLAPSESVALTVNAPAGLVDENSAGISISGWNVEKQSLSLKP